MERIRTSCRGRRRGRSLWGVVVFFFCFSVLLMGVCHYYLLPAMEAARDASPVYKKQLVAQAWVILVVVLFVMLVLMMMTFDVRSFFFPRKTPPREKTEYVDAWEESGKRMKVPKKEEGEEKDEG